MSTSPPTSTTTTVASPTAVVEHQNYWCHECDMSVLVQPLSATTIPPICPHCRRDFLEQMDSFTPPPPEATDSFLNPIVPFYPLLDRTTNFPLPSTAPSDDNFLLDSPYLQSLIQHLMSTNDPHRTTPTPPHYNSPASKNAIESLDHVAVDMTFLQKDPTIVCPVCKDQFVVGSEAKVLPCKHMYHPDCIIPWLEMNNSCPVCRYRLQSHDEIETEAEDTDNDTGPRRLDELLEDVEDLFHFRDTLRNVVRRHQLINSNNYENVDEQRWIGSRIVDAEFLFSPSQMGEEEGGSRDAAGIIGNHVERADSVETVSSWPRWPVVGSGSGDGDVGVGVGVGVSSSGRGDDEVETMKV